MVKREIKGRYFIAFLLTLAVFALGIFFGIIMSDIKVSKIYDSERSLMTNLLVQDIQNQLFLSDTPCGFVNDGLVSDELFKVGDRLTALENDLGKNDPGVLSLKTYYTVLQAKDFLFYNNVNKKCGNKTILNLFFYSNDPKKCDRCEDQGFILSYLRANNENIRTYSFDVDLEIPLIKYLVKSHNITSVPAVVFNDKVYTGFLDKETAEGIIR